MLEILLITAILILIAGFAAVFYFLKKHLNSTKAPQSEALFTLLNQNIQGMHERIDKTTDAISQRLDKAAVVIQNVQRELGAMQEIGRSIKDFQEFLNSPKLRGNIGEEVLYDSLAKAFSSDHYALQYKFKEGQVVDAIIKTRDGVIPIDSKFPMDHFKRLQNSASEQERAQNLREFIKSVKKHIDDVAKKYILPQEGTMDFAVVYVPSESVYYEILLQNETLMEHARGKKIMMVSPNSFFHFLRVIMMGLERGRLQEQAQKIWEILKGVQQETQKFGDALSVLSRHITNAKNSMDSVSGEYAKLSSKVDQIKLLK